jgi:uncharacterized C2H2 Zn-finger protein
MSASGFTCERCGRSFGRGDSLRKHIYMAHEGGAERLRKGAAGKGKGGKKRGNPSLDPGLEVELAAFQLLDDGHSPFEIMQVHKLDVETMKRILQDYRELQSLAQPARREGEAFLEIARVFGERFRNGCDFYNDESGVCLAYSLYDVDEELRRSFPGLFKGFGGKTRYHVLSHPWICTLCRRATRGGE